MKTVGSKIDAERFSNKQSSKWNSWVKSETDWWPIFGLVLLVTFSNLEFYLGFVDYFGVEIVVQPITAIHIAFSVG